MTDKMQATEAQYEAAHDAYYAATTQYRIKRMGNKFVLHKLMAVPLESVVNDDDVAAWHFDDQETAERFLIVKVLDEVTNAVVATTPDAIRRAAIEECAKVADAWKRADEIQLRAGEMTAQELRSVKAVVNSIAAMIRSLSE